MTSVYPLDDHLYHWHTFCPAISTNLFAVFQSKHARWQQWQNDLKDGRKKRRRKVSHLVQDLRHHSKKPLLFLQRDNTREICSHGKDHAWVVCCSYTRNNKNLKKDVGITYIVTVNLFSWHTGTKNKDFGLKYNVYHYLPVHRCLNGAKIKSMKICISCWGQEVRNLSTTARLTPTPALPPVPVPVNLCILPYKSLCTREITSDINTSQ